MCSSVARSSVVNTARRIISQILPAKLCSALSMYSKFSRISRKGVPLAIGRLGLMGMAQIVYDPPCTAGTTASFSRTPDQAVSDVKGSQDILNERHLFLKLDDF